MWGGAAGEVDEKEGVVARTLDRVLAPRVCEGFANAVNV